VSTERIELEPQPASVGAARRFVRAALRASALAAVSEDAELMVSELVTNAVLHARTGVTVTVSSRRRGRDLVLHVGVRDTSARSLRAPKYSQLASTGRGLKIGRELAADSGVRLEGGGKTVWFELVAPDGAAGRGKA